MAQGSALRVQVLADSVVRAKEAIEAALAAVVNVDAIGGADGWLRVEIVDTVGNERKTHSINNDILGAIIRMDVPVLRFESRGGRLQDVFLQLTGGTIR